MGWLPMYADDGDLRRILDWLNSEDSIGFLVSRGPRRWAAVSRLSEWGCRRTALWHVPSGPLPLLTPAPSEQGLTVENPWESWVELCAGADPATPYFGAGHPGIIWFNNHCREGVIGLSSFEWIGNHYGIIGSAAHPDTEKWWRRLGRRVKRGAVRIPRFGVLDGPHPEIWALPGALAQIEAGMARDSNP